MLRKWADELHGRLAAQRTTPFQRAVRWSDRIVTGFEIVSRTVLESSSLDDEQVVVVHGPDPEG